MASNSRRSRRSARAPPTSETRSIGPAPHRMADTMEISRPADAVWTDLTSDETLSWCRMLAGVTWTSPRPFGPGTTRLVRAPGGMLALREIYFRWEDGRRKSFYVAEA